MKHGKEGDDKMDNIQSKDTTFEFINDQFHPYQEKIRVESFLRRIEGGLDEDDPFGKLPEKYQEAGESRLMKKVGEALLEGYCNTRKHSFFGIAGSHFIEQFHPVMEKLQSAGIMPEKLVHHHEGIRKETLQAATNAGLYITMVAGIVEKPLRSELLPLEFYRPVPGFTLKGHSAIKIPLEVDNTAADLPDTGAITDKSTAFSSTTVTVKWAYSMTRLTQELLEVSQIDILVANLESMGYALNDHINTDVVADFDTSTPAGAPGANANYKALGGGTYLTYDNLNTELGLMKGTNESIPTDLIVHWNDYHQMIKDDDFRYAMAFQNHGPGADLYAAYGGNITENGVTTARCGKLLGMNLFATNAVTSKDHFMVDRRNYGWFVWGNPLAVIDFQPTGYLATDIVSWVSYKMVASKVKAAYRILSNT